MGLYKGHVWKQAKVVWDDLRFPFMGQKLDTSSGRIDYNFAELGVDFADNARYAVTEQISIIAQFGHDWKTGSAISPHIHWAQSSADMPNLLIEYRWYDNGDLIPATWTKVAVGDNAFAYSSGTLAQLSEFDITVPVGIDAVSSLLEIKFFRDVANDSTLFSGSDPLTGNALVKEFDIHYQRDSNGSNQEYYK